MTTIQIPSESGNAVFPDHFKWCIGSGRMALALRKDYQDALRLVQKEIGFRYLRGHGILCDDVGIYRDRFFLQPDDYKGPKPILNFNYLDKIYDSLLENKIRPLVEISFMPSALASSDHTALWEKVNKTPPKDYAEWRRLIKGMVSHLIARYGKEEVSQWPFEVWNEPDGSGFWTGEQEGYFRLYRETAFAVKEVDPDIKVGGPATCPAGINWITPFLEMCQKENVPVDFASTHSYYGAKLDILGELGYQELHALPYALEQFKEARSRVRDSAFPGISLHITEYNTSWFPNAPIHDTAFNAAFLGRLLSEGGDIADSFSYFTFCDVVEEVDIPRSQFHGGFGLLAYNEIPKPTFHLFSFFSKLGRALLYRNENMIVTRQTDGSVVLVAWNPVVHPDQTKDLPFSMSIPFAGTEARVRRLRVDEQNGNAWNAWNQIGRPRFPDKAQLEILRHASIPAQELSRTVCQNGRIAMDFTLSRNEVSLIQIGRLEDESESYFGLDDSAIPGGR